MTFILKPPLEKYQDVCKASLVACFEVAASPFCLGRLFEGSYFVLQAWAKILANSRDVVQAPVQQTISHYS